MQERTSGPIDCPGSCTATHVAVVGKQVRYWRVGGLSGRAFMRGMVIVTLSALVAALAKAFGRGGKFNITYKQCIKTYPTP